MGESDPPELTQLTLSTQLKMGKGRIWSSTSPRIETIDMQDRGVFCGVRSPRIDKIEKYLEIILPPPPYISIPMLGPPIAPPILPHPP